MNGNKNDKDISAIIQKISLGFLFYFPIKDRYGFEESWKEMDCYDLSNN